MENARKKLIHLFLQERRLFFLAQEAMPKAYIPLRNTLETGVHSAETNPLILPQQTEHAIIPSRKAELLTLPRQATKAGLRTLFSQPVKTGMPQRKPGHHILPYIAGRTAVPPKKQDKIHHSLAEIYLVRQNKCLLPNRKRPQGLRG